MADRKPQSSPPASPGREQRLPPVNMTRLSTLCRLAVLAAEPRAMPRSAILMTQLGPRKGFSSLLSRELLLRLQHIPAGGKAAASAVQAHMVQSLAGDKNAGIALFQVAGVPQVELDAAGLAQAAKFSGEHLQLFACYYFYHYGVLAPSLWCGAGREGHQLSNHFHGSGGHDEWICGSCLLGLRGLREKFGGKKF